MVPRYWNAKNEEVKKIQARTKIAHCAALQHQAVRPWPRHE